MEASACHGELIPDATRRAELTRALQVGGKVSRDAVLRDDAELLTLRLRYHRAMWLQSTAAIQLERLLELLAAQPEQASVLPGDGR